MSNITDRSGYKITVFSGVELQAVSDIRLNCPMIEVFGQ